MKKSVGEIVAGYELREFVGSGGFGEIFRARQLSVNRDVAIKFASAERANDPQFIRLFEFEAHLVAKLEHPHIVPLYDYWRQPDGAFLILRWMSGGNLHSVLNREHLPLETVVRYIEQLAEALAVAHRHGVVHCDIKPANILLDEDGNAYLADFGIARTPISALSAEHEQKVIGTPGYMSPEQILSKPITAQSDIYSLGVLLYEMLSGTRLYPMHDAVIIMLHRQLNDPVPSIQTIRHDLPKSFDNILERVLSKDHHERYQDVLEFSRDLRVAYAEVSAEQKLRQAARLTDGAATLLFNTTSILNVGGGSFIENPYKGLQAFQEGDALDFFGREEVVAQILNRLREDGDKSICLTVTGPSGSGKSSLVRAGLLPVIRIGGLPGSQQWYLTDMLPGSEPFTALAAALMRIAVVPSAERMAGLQDNPDDFPSLLRDIMPNAGSSTKLLLFIDQFEELFTLVEDETIRTNFIRCLIAALNDPDPYLHLLITLRADFYDRPLMYPDLAAYLREYTEVVVPMTRDELESAITSPAKRVGVSFEPGLVALILKDIQRQPNALPQLQFMLAELFERRSLFVLSQAAYESIGGVAGSLTRRAEQLYADLSPQHQEVIRELFLRLVAVGDDGMVTRRRVLRSELGSVRTTSNVWDSLIELCVQHRLLMYDRDGGTRQITVEVAHEALLQGWDRLNGWLEESFDDLRVHRQVTAMTYDWLSSAKDESCLAVGARLSKFEDVLQQKTMNLNDTEREFLEASIAQREHKRLEIEAQQRRELSLQQRARRFLLALAAVLLLATGISTVLGAVAVNNAGVAQEAQGRAEESLLVSRSGELAVQALLSVNEGRIDQALLLSVEALGVADTLDARSSLQTALTDQPHLLRYLHTGSPVRTVAFSPDGKWFASGMSDGQILLYDTDTFTAEPLVQGDTLVNIIAFSPDGRLLASGGADELIRLWDVETREPIGEPLAFHTGEIWSLAFSPDGSLLASAGEDQSIQLWNTADRSPNGEPLQGHQDIVFSVVFSPDGEILASGSADGSIRLWDVETREPIGEPLTGHSNWVMSLSFSPDGRTLASGSADDTIRLWDMETRALVGSPLQAHEDWVRSVQFGPDGRHLVSGSADGTLRLWDVTNRRQASELLDVHQDQVWGAAFDPSGYALASGSLDGSVILWSAEARAILGMSLVDADSVDPIQSIAFDGDSINLASAVGVQTWDAASGTETAEFSFDRPAVNVSAIAADQPILVLDDSNGGLERWSIADQMPLNAAQTVHQTFILSLALSPQGDVAVSGDNDGQLALTHFGDIVTSQPLTGNSDVIYALAFDSTGERFVSGADDGSILLWDTETGTVVGDPLTGHNNRIWSLSFSDDGQYLASGSEDGSVILWDVATQRQIRQLTPEVGEVMSLVFHPSGQEIAIGGMAKTVAILDVTTGQRIGQPLLGHAHWVTAMAYNADGTTLVSGDRVGNLIEWSLDTAAQRAWACRVANRNFTDAEWQQFFSDQPYHTSCSELRNSQ